MKTTKLNFLVCILFTLALQGKSQSNLEQNQLTIEPYVFKSSKGVEVQAELGKFWVPENRSNPTSRKIQLSFVRFKSISAKPGSPIIYLAGGPGGSGISTAMGDRFELFMALREFGDVIAFDQRGTGLSNHLESCEPSYKLALDKPGNVKEMIDVIRENTKHCIEFWKSKGIDVLGYNNIESANDIEDLRKVLNAKKVSLWGISYGTQLAFTFVKKYESSVDRLILAALEATGDNVKRPSYVDHFLSRVEREIQKDTIAARQYPDLKKLMKSTLDKLEQEPIITVIKDRKGNEVKVGISKTDLQLVTSFFWTKNPSDIKALPARYQAIAKGNYQEIAKTMYRMKSFVSMSDYYGMGILMDAMTGFSKDRMRVVETESTNAILGRTTNFPFPDLAEGLGLSDLGESYRKEVPSKVRGLFLSGTLDGRTFLEDAQRIAKQFKNVKHVILENAGHDMFEQSPKVQELIIQYMRGQSIPERLELEPITFITK
jgi:pimeloyl-ACP methyl ester carboxylesterase